MSTHESVAVSPVELDEKDLDAVFGGGRSRSDDDGVKVPDTIIWDLAGGG